MRVKQQLVVTPKGAAPREHVCRAAPCRVRWDATLTAHRDQDFPTQSPTTGLRTGSATPTHEKYRCP